MWRGATTKKAIKGYSDAIVANHKKSQPILPPTNKVTHIPGSIMPINKRAKQVVKGTGQTQESMNFAGSLNQKAP
jgi:hypothetical protein